MKDYRIIDAHSHIFPGKVADKAVESINRFYDMAMYGQGTAKALLASGRQIGVDKYLICSTATRADQVESINDFIFESCARHSEFIGFATIQPGQPDLEEQMGKIIARGFSGIKLHPDFQQFYLDSDEAMKIYEIAEGRLPILFHTGDFRYDYSKPGRLAKVAERFPRLTCIGAHFGGWSEWEEALTAYDNTPNVYMDTCSSLYTLPRKQVWKFINRYGPERFFFGTDFPMWNHADELRRFLALGLPEDINRAILADNFERVVLGYKNCYADKKLP